MANKIIIAAEEAIQVARGEVPAAAIWHNGQKYVPIGRIAELETALFQISDCLGDEDEMRAIAERALTINP